MADPKMPDYKLYIFANTVYLTNEEREIIKQKLKKNHATTLFLYGAGIMKEECVSIRVDIAQRSEKPLVNATFIVIAMMFFMPTKTTSHSTPPVAVKRSFICQSACAPLRYTKAPATPSVQRKFVFP